MNVSRTTSRNEQQKKNRERLFIIIIQTSERGVSCYISLNQTNYLAEKLNPWSLLLIIFFYKYSEDAPPFNIFSKK